MLSIGKFICENFNTLSDIKPENILIKEYDRSSQSIQVILCDFGFAKEQFTNLKAETMVGTVLYLVSFTQLMKFNCDRHQNS